MIYLQTEWRQKALQGLAFVRYDATGSHFWTLMWDVLICSWSHEMNIFIPFLSGASDRFSLRYSWSLDAKNDSMFEASKTTAIHIMDRRASAATSDIRRLKFWA